MLERGPLPHLHDLDGMARFSGLWRDADVKLRSAVEDVP